jgi:hypothetical protein
VIYWEELYYADNTVFAHWQVFQKVYVSDISVEDALEQKKERILLHTFPWNRKDKYSVVHFYDEDDFLRWENYIVEFWEYIAEIPLSPTTKKVTVTIDWEQKEIKITEEELNKLLNR